MPLIFNSHERRGPAGKHIYCGPLPLVEINASLSLPNYVHHCLTVNGDYLCLPPLGTSGLRLTFPEACFSSKTSGHGWLVITRSIASILTLSGGRGADLVQVRCGRQPAGVRTFLSVRSDYSRFACYRISHDYELVRNREGWVSRKRDLDGVRGSITTSSPT